jgi:creatinine amidohydrolase
MSEAIPIFELPHHEAQRVLSTGATVYLPINPVEYHGPHLSLHNDALISHGLIRDLHARVDAPRGMPLLLGADLEIGVDPCPGPGTRTTSFSDARRNVREACRALIELGATRIVLMTFHGSPLHSVTMDAGIALCRSLGARAFAPLQAAQRFLLEREDNSVLEPAVAHIEDRALARSLLDDLSLDFHAGFLETSLSLHYAPDSVSAIYKTLPPCPKLVGHPLIGKLGGALGRVLGSEIQREIGFAAVGRAWYELRPFPGYTSHPALAHASAGKFLASQFVDFMAEISAATLDRGEPAPHAFMRWVKSLTFGGRVPTHAVRAGDVLGDARFLAERAR